MTEFAGCTPAELLVVQRATQDWAPTTDDVALSLILDDCAHIRAYGGRETRTLDTALRIKRPMVDRALRAYEREQLAAARATLGHKAADGS